ncbi:hypothetical protein MIR68_012439 [Amoeboaphelidium protococcarum]|nr:hypothetical protein MIR68_012439 [Amoeboaphelidium protococcarum]
MSVFIGGKLAEFTANRGGTFFVELTIVEVCENGEENILQIVKSQRSIAQHQRGEYKCYLDCPLSLKLSIDRKLRFYAVVREVLSLGRCPVYGYSYQDYNLQSEDDDQVELYFDVVSPVLDDQLDDLQYWLLGISPEYEQFGPNAPQGQQKQTWTNFSNRRHQQIIHRGQVTISLMFLRQKDLTKLDDSILGDIVSPSAIETSQRARPLNADQYVQQTPTAPSSKKQKNSLYVARPGILKQSQ